MRPLDINKTQEWLEVLHPYLRWFMLAMYGAMFLYINRMFIKDPVLRKWVMASFEETPNRSSGKSFASFVFTKIIAFATVVAIVYSPLHILPEYFLISLLAFVGGLYGIKIAGKYFSGGSDTTSSSATTTQSSVVVEETKKEQKKEEPKKEEGKDEQSEIG